MAVIKINFETIEEIVIPALQKEFAAIKKEKHLIESSTVLKYDSEVSNVYQNICNRFELVQKQIRWLNHVCKDCKRVVSEAREAIDDVNFPSIEKPPFVVQ